MLINEDTNISMVCISHGIILIIRLKTHVDLSVMNKIIVLCSFLLICIIFIACQEPAVCTFRLEFVNNSQDTVGYSVYAHKKYTNNDDVCYIISGNSIAPMCSSIGFAQHYGSDDSWSSFFKEKGIDTLYIYIAKEVMEAKGQKCKLPEIDSNILKTYKYYAGNTDLTHMVSPTITYP